MNTKGLLALVAALASTVSSFSQLKSDDAVIIKGKIDHDLLFLMVLAVFLNVGLKRYCIRTLQTIKWKRHKALALT